jgi:outer membrane protein
MSFRMFTPFLACSAILLAGNVAQAQNKIAVISLQTALFNTAEIKKADAEMQATLLPRQQQAEKLNQELAKIQQQLNTDTTLTQAAQFDLQNEGKRKQTQLTRIQEDLQADATAMRQNILAKATDRMQAVVKKMADEKGLDLVVDTQVTLYFKQVLDLTADATAAYDKTYPVAAAAPAAPPKK